MLAEDGGSAAQGSPALACSGPYGAPGLRNLAQKARWGWDVAHQGLGLKGGPAQSGRRRGPGGGVGRRLRSGRGGGPPGFGSPRVAAPWYCRGGRRSGGLELGWRRGISVRSKLTVAALRWNSEAGEVRGRGWRPLWCSWGRGEAAARPSRDSGAAEQRGRGGAGAPRGGAVLVRRLGFVAAFGLGVSVLGGPLGPIIGRAVIPGLRAVGRGRDLRRGDRALLAR